MDGWIDAWRVLQVRFRSNQTPDGSPFSFTLPLVCFFLRQPTVAATTAVATPVVTGGGVTTATAQTAPRVGVSHLRACLWLNVKAITVAAHGSLDNKMFTLGKIIALDVSVTQKPINMWLNRSGCNVSESINECNGEKRCNYC